MKKYILTLCMALLSVCFTLVHAQREELPQDDDEFIEDGFPGDFDEDPIKVGDLPKAKTKCNRTRCEGHENISFSFNNTPHALRMEALVNSIERKGLSDWLFIQESIIKKELDGRNRHVSSTYEFARNEYFANLEKGIANRNIPSLSSGRNRVINEAKHKRTSFYKNIKLLRARLQEIKRGNITRSLYATKTYNNRPMSYYKTESSITSVLNSEQEKFYSNEVKINEDLLIRDQLGEMLKSIRAVNQLGVTDNILQVLKNKQIGYYNDFNRWHQISLMQRYLSGLKKGSNSGNIWPKEFGTNDYLLAYAKAHRKKDINIFHKEYWKVILKRDYRNNPLKSRDAINKYLRLLDAEITRLLNNVSINVNTSVDFLVSELNITDVNGLKWLNNNPEKAIEMQSLLNLTRIDPNPNVFNSTKRNLIVRILENGTVEEMITKLKLDAYRKYLYEDEKMAYNLRVFAYENSHRGIIRAKALIFIKEGLEAIKNGGTINFEEEIVNKLKGKANCVYLKLENNNFIKKTLGKFLGTKAPVHLIIEQDNLDEGTSGETEYGDIIKIILDIDDMKNTPSLWGAHTILHEAIHADIYRKIRVTSRLHYDRYTREYSLPDGSRAHFPTLFDYYDNFPNNPQHNFMADFYREAMEKGLKEYATLIGKTYPDQLYKDIAWSGLHNTKAWDNMFADPVFTRNEQRRILRAINNFKNSGNNECN